MNAVLHDLHFVAIALRLQCCAGSIAKQHVRYAPHQLLPCLAKTNITFSYQLTWTSAINAICRTTKSCFVYMGYWGPWSACNASCGPGSRTRHVDCFSYGPNIAHRAVVSDSLYDIAALPSSSVYCSTGSCLSCSMFGSAIFSLCTAWVQAFWS